MGDDRPTAIAITDLQVLFIWSSFRSTSETSDEGRLARARSRHIGGGFEVGPARGVAGHSAALLGVCHHRLVRPTVVIVDDHPAFRTSVRALLEADGYDVIGESADGADALETIAALRPEIVLLDVQLPGLNGFEVAERLASQAVVPAVVLISSREASAYGSRLQAAPSRGFIPKNELSGKALAALLD